MTEGRIMGVPRERFDDHLLRTTRDLSTALAVAATCGAGAVDTAHVVLALARIPGGATAGLFAAAGLPVGDVEVAVREETGEPGATTPACDLGPASLTAALREAVDDLAGGDPDRLIGERHLAAACLGRLAEDVVSILRDWARVDVGAWLAELAVEGGPGGADDGGPVFDDAGRLLPARFTVPALQILDMMRAEAEQPGRRRLGALSLLRALAVAPNGLLEQGVSFLGQDMRTVRANLLALTGRRAPERSGDPAGVREAMDPPLVAALDEAAVACGRRGGDGVDDRDLLEGLLARRSGLAATVLTECGVDPAGLRRFASLYYVPQEAVEPDEPGLPLDDALHWLRERVIGQDAVLAALEPRIELIRRGVQRGFRGDDRSRGTFLFCGPSGTGKTMTARAVARVLYGSEDDVLVFEMGQFNARESINNFVGAPPGYIGYGEGKLTNGLRDNPNRVLLFDEVEKADHRVFDALLRLLDEGRIDDPAGPVRDARNSTIVLTSNFAAGELARISRRTGGAAEVEPFSFAPAAAARSDPAEGERTATARVRKVLRGFFRPEFLNRLDEVVVFQPFGEPELRRIAVSTLREQAGRVRDQLGIELTWADDVPERLAATAIERRAGEAARGVNRCVHDLLPQLLRQLDDAEARGARVDTVRVTGGADGEDLRMTVTRDGDGALEEGR